MSLEAKDSSHRAIFLKAKRLRLKMSFRAKMNVALGQGRCLVLMSACLVVLSSQVCDGQDGQDVDRRSDILYRYLREYRQKPRIFKQCDGESDMCIPSVRTCCPGLQCVNKVKDFCLYPLEPCRCQKT